MRKIECRVEISLATTASLSSHFDEKEIEAYKSKIEGPLLWHNMRLHM
jgi:hypothetical protein